MKFNREITFSFVFFALIFFGFEAAFAQIIVKPQPPKTPVINKSQTPAEKSLAVDSKVNISLCVTAGKISVNGWERDEIRAYVSRGGSQVGFKILQKSRQTEKPVWVMVLGFDPANVNEREANECLMGDEIELDVPRGATVNIKSRISETTIESVGKARIESVGGNIFLNNISQGIEAKSYEGNITVSKSGGAIGLSTTTGNIVAFDVSPSEIGDFFKAKTINGAITLEQIEHRQIEASTSTGSIKFTSEFSDGGKYDFGTQNGTILLMIPEKTSCKITAFYGFGQFISEIPLQNERRSNAIGSQSLTGQIGNGEAALNLKTFNGRILIRKK